MRSHSSLWRGLPALQGRYQCATIQEAARVTVEFARSAPGAPE